MSLELRSRTLFDELGEAVATVCPGHQKATIFSLAVRREFNTKEIKVSECDITHEYWDLTQGKWRRSNKQNVWAVPVTVMEW